ncbi:CHY zinc finger protein [Streptococcus moroccensis]|uniref:CHY-type Zn-finger protein n=1 Tax=Streptococcus moroccensis TaxID=1451356 RepID=A0ABT9YUD3_9STRE|nr:CHY zinc finger protein [Streptococcus moroccensis]MDQ0223380.1 putative CHY-type Zn-finger protein [Streptococcus moroccensis]
MFYGLEIDGESRCLHYHSPLDVVVLKCGQCQRYYACYECHDALEDHNFLATGPDVEYPVLCGVYKTYLTQQEYQDGACPHCQHPFNPKCALHKSIYFTTDKIKE